MRKYISIVMLVTSGIITIFPVGSSMLSVAIVHVPIMQMLV